MHRYLAQVAAAAIAVGAWSGVALASLPVPRTYSGCVVNGVYKSEDGYTIRVHRADGTLVDLSKWEKQRVRITGSLLPSDRFYLKEAPVVLGPCR